MCGIVGYVGSREAQPILINSLKRLEYRGYDSCGIALHPSLVKDHGGGIQVYKDEVRVAKLEQCLPQGSPSQMGIGHTRWATHGKPSQINAHPHLDCGGRIAVVHNGVIDNFQSLREQLMGEGHVFRSETDTEVLPHLVEKYYQGDLEEAVKRALGEVRGSYAIIVLEADSSVLVAARKESPLIIGVGDRENFVASDAPAVLDYTDRVIYLEDDDVVLLSPGEIRITNNGRAIVREAHAVPWGVEDVQKGGYDHFMLKEIHEQPKVIQNALKGHISAVEPVVNLEVGPKRGIEDILLVACGTSYHAALVGRYVIEKLARIPVRVEIASEFNYIDSVLGRTWAIGITQSGETADTLNALRQAIKRGCKTLAITNVVGSSVTRLADQVFYMGAGPEIGVAATKSFIAQLVALYLLTLSLDAMDTQSREGLIADLRLLPSRVQSILDGESELAQCGHELASYRDVFLVARGINFPVALEGALKLKEIAYINASGYAAGELKHGPFALLTPECPVIAIAARDNTYETLIANIKEIKARESPVIALAEEGDRDIEKYVDRVIWVPGVNPLVSPVVNSVALQLVAYYAARGRGCPIDMPRNLAKSVTVE
ncbi:MAG: glutamine--fructose-6-phosphate transaminase (isomerizing) [Dehalococcoidia bacterium]